MILTDGEIAKRVAKGSIGIDPWVPEHLNPASHDLTLSPLVRLAWTEGQVLDCADVERGHTALVEMGDSISSLGAEGVGYPVRPGQFLLASTNERVRVPDTLVARVEGKSSIGRLGLNVHVTAGFIDPGFEGEVTLEIANVGPWNVILRPGMRICQIAFERLTTAASKPYGAVGHYQGQVGPVESRYRMEDR